MAILWLLTSLITVSLLATPYYYLAPLPAASLLALLLMFRNPVLGFYIIVFLIPFGAYRKLGGALNIPWLVAGVVLAIIFLKAVVVRRLADTLHTSIWPLLIAYLLISLLAASLSSYPETAYKNVMLLGAAWGFVFIGLAVVDAHGFWHTLPQVVIWSISLSSILALFSFYFGLAGFSEQTLSGSLTRSVGGSIDPNNMCLMILFALPLMAHRFAYNRSPRERVLMAALVMINLVALATTHSRSGFITLLIVTVLLAFHYRHRLQPRNIGLVMGGALLAGTVLLATIPMSFWERLSTLTDDWREDAALSRRASYLDVARDAILDHPLLGAGPGVFSDIYAHSEAARLYVKDPAKRARRAHNTYLEIAVGTGLLGAVVFLALLIRVTLDFLIAERNCRLAGRIEQEDLIAGFRIGFIGMLFFLAMFSDMYHKYLLLSLVVSQLGLAFTRIQATPSSTMPIHIFQHENDIGKIKNVQI